MPIFEGYGALKSFFSLLSNVFKAMFQVHFLIQEKKTKVFVRHWNLLLEKLFGNLSKPQHCEQLSFEMNFPVLPSHVF